MKTLQPYYMVVNSPQSVRTRPGCKSIQFRNSGAVNAFLFTTRQIAPTEIDTYSADEGYYIDYSFDISFAAGAGAQIEVMQLLDIEPENTTSCR